MQTRPLQKVLHISGKNKKNTKTQKIQYKKYQTKKNKQKKKKKAVFSSVCVPIHQTTKKQKKRGGGGVTRTWRKKIQKTCTEKEDC